MVALAVIERIALGDKDRFRDSNNLLAVVVPEFDADGKAVTTS